MREYLIAFLEILLGIFYSIGTMFILPATLNSKEMKRFGKSSAILICIISICIWFFLPEHFHTAISLASWAAMIFSAIFVIISILMSTGYIMKPISRVVEKHFIWVNKNDVGKQDFIESIWILASIIVSSIILFLLKHPLTIDIWKRVISFLS